MNYSAISRTSMLGKTLRLPLRLIPANMRIPIMQGPLRGKKWIAGSGNHGCWLGSYEFEKQKVFSTAIRRGDVVYDLGANVGFYSLFASHLVGPEGLVLSFEPLPRNVRFLRKHLEINRVTNCRVLEVAVARSSGTANFDVGPDAAMGHLSGESQNTLSVRTVALDDLVASGNFPPPNVVKCDIEGGEYDALSGASTILAKHAPAIFLATHGLDVQQRCCKLLMDFGYELQPLDGLPMSRASEFLATNAKER